jgi:hypothetical protein
MIPLYSSGWLSAEYLAARPEPLRWVIQSPFNCETFDVSTSSSDE